jgi:hypothetical protein
MWSEFVIYIKRIIFTGIWFDWNVKRYIENSELAYSQLENDQNSAMN